MGPPRPLAVVGAAGGGDVAIGILSAGAYCFAVVVEGDTWGVQGAALGISNVLGPPAPVGISLFAS